MSEEIIKRQIVLLEEKLRGIQSRKSVAVKDQIYESAAELRDEEVKVMTQLLEKDPGSEMVMNNKYFVTKFLRDGNKLNYIQELAKDGTITVKYKFQITSVIEYSKGVDDDICERYGLSKKEWLILCKEYNKTNTEDKIFFIEPEEGGTMKNFEIGINPKEK